MKLACHIKKDDKNFTLWFGLFYSNIGKVNASFENDYCYHGITEENIREILAIEDVEKALILKSGEKIVANLTLESITEVDFIKDNKSGKVSTAMLLALCSKLKSVKDQK